MKIVRSSHIPEHVEKECKNPAVFLDFFINGVKVERVAEYKYLGQQTEF